MKFIDVLKDLIKKVLGGIPVQDNKVIEAINEIDKKLNKVSYSNYFDLISNITQKNLLSNYDSNKKIVNSFFEIFNVNSSYQDKVNDLFIRRRRYNLYKDLTKKISRLNRAIKVLRSNIISSDSLKNRSINFLITREGIDKEKEINEAKEICDFLNISNYRVLSKIIDNTLLYGDYFLEIVSIKDVNFINESTRQQNTFIIDIPAKNRKNKFTINFILEKNVEEKIFLLEDEQKNVIKLQDIMLIFHKPHNVIKLSIGSDIYGYLIIPEQVIKSRMFMGNFAFNIFNQEQMQQYFKSLNFDIYASQEAMHRSIEITKRILDFLKEHIKDNVIDENLDLKSTFIKLALSSLFATGDFKTFNNYVQDIYTVNINNIPVRFVSPSRMQEFSINVDEYEPYGTSIFDPILFDAHLLISDKIASSIERLTKSIERRIINYEIDNRNSIAFVESLKEVFRKKKVIFNNIESYDTIPGLITPFEDYYIPQKDGQPFVTFNTEGPTSQHQTQVDDMKFKRDEIVSDLNIPPAYLGLEENIESKATLFLQSVLFAVEIMDYQELFADFLTSLLDKIKLILGKNVKTVLIKFPSPVIMSSASEIEHINNVSSVKDFLNELGIQNKHILDRYLPFLSEYFSEEVKIKEELEKLEAGESGENNEEEEF